MPGLGPVFWTAALTFGDELIHGFVFCARLMVSVGPIFHWLCLLLLLVLLALSFFRSTILRSGSHQLINGVTLLLRRKGFYYPVKNHLHCLGLLILRQCVPVLNNFFRLKLHILHAPRDDCSRLGLLSRARALGRRLRRRRRCGGLFGFLALGLSFPLLHWLRWLSFSSVICLSYLSFFGGLPGTFLVTFLDPFLCRNRCLLRWFGLFAKVFAKVFAEVFAEVFAFPSCTFSIGLSIWRLRRRLRRLALCRSRFRLWREDHSLLRSPRFRIISGSSAFLACAFARGIRRWAHSLCSAFANCISRIRRLCTWKNYAS
mmetsp:Transcript_79013/g.130625  ORF Transcript_79013/g.130625 Transcript_79013/m.130625 type:complete len:316 (-) Transcript_79013:315-1262(-)